jgi:hypothetical protein
LLDFPADAPLNFSLVVPLDFPVDAPLDFPRCLAIVFLTFPLPVVDRKGAAHAATTSCPAPSPVFSTSHTRLNGIIMARNFELMLIPAPRLP